MAEILIVERKQAACEKGSESDGKLASMPESIPATVRMNGRCGEFSLKVSLDSQSVIDAAKYLIAHQFKRHSVMLNKPEQVKDFLLLNMAPYEREVLTCLFLDNHYRLIAFELLFYGSIRNIEINPREVIKRALQLNAASLMVAHNHPSGSCQPSDADEMMTYRLNKALRVADIELVDHFIVGGEAALSMRENGIFDPNDE